MNWFAYRLPGTDQIHTGKSECLSHRLIDNCFAVCPFDTESEHMHFIPAGQSLRADDDWNSLCNYSNICEQYVLPEQSTTPEEHAQAVNTILATIDDGMLKKCVTARAIVNQGEVDLKSTFMSLCDRYPSAFVFCFHTRGTGTWIGASPELLLSGDDDSIETCSLAGTRPAGTAGEWDEKNLAEQKMVTDFITGRLRDRGFDLMTEGPVTYQAGPVEHLRTAITAKRQDEKDWTLATMLSPTPALLGYPRMTAQMIINEVEKFKRGYYGGFCGPITDSGRQFAFYVVVRAMSVIESAYCLFSGGGIVKGSVAEAEWEETERKAATLRDVKILRC